MQPEKARANILGIVGLIMVGVATVLSPSGFLILPLCLLVPCGFGGLIVCATSLYRKPLWPGLVGLVVGIACVLAWGWFFATPFIGLSNQAKKLGVGIGDSVVLRMAASELSVTGENQREPDGTPKVDISFAGLAATATTDPWGHQYRYVLVPTARGYTFISDGPDGIADTLDDIDLMSITPTEGFEIKPVSPRAKPSAPPQ